MKHSDFWWSQEQISDLKKALQKRDAALVALFGLVAWCITHVPY